MLSKLILTAAMAGLIGLTACAPSINDAALCEEITPLASEARAALLDHAQDVPDQVGEASTRLMVAIRAGCHPTS